MPRPAETTTSHSASVWAYCSEKTRGWIVPSNVSVGGRVSRVARAMKFCGVRVVKIAEGAWFVVPGVDDDVLAGPMVDLYFRALKRQGFPLAWEAYRPSEMERN